MMDVVFCLVTLLANLVSICPLVSTSNNRNDFDPLTPSPKTWWMKEITRDLYTAGRLTETQIKYAADVGFKSIITNFNFTQPGQIGEEYLPTTIEAEDIATNLAGLYYAGVLDPGNSNGYASVEAVERFTMLMAEAPKPVLFNCLISRTASYVALNYLANQTMNDPDFQPRINSSEIYRRASVLGHLYNGVMERAVIATITGEPVVENPPPPDVDDVNWSSRYWLARPVYANIYTGGQIRSSYIEEVSELFSTVVNIRQRAVENGEPSQEEVTLINILDNTGTYTGSGRQTEEQLLQNRIDPNKTNDYIGPGSDVNYASRNALEFGDDIGYSKDSDQAFWEGQGFFFYNTAIGGEYTYDLAMWNAYRDQWVEAAQRPGNVIFHCSRAFRGPVGAFLTAGYIYNLDSNWALTRAAELGIHYEEAGYDNIVQLFRDVLG